LTEEQRQTPSVTRIAPMKTMREVK
jgi:hypothetical protein